jgi:quinol monooxygenase YgiN
MPDPKGGSMKFIQTIGYTTSRPDDMKALSDRFREENPDTETRGFLGYKVLKDRDQDNAYMIVAEFESYELAMENSARPETDAFAREMASMADGPPTFGNYDVIEEAAP